MAINTLRENLKINKKVTTKKEIIFVEGDVIVPDSKPDILNIICTSGVLCLDKKELIDEKVKIEGKINTYIMYMTDDSKDNIRGINADINLSEVINIPNITNEMRCKLKTNIKEIEAKIINERKLSIKATIEINIEIFSQEEISIVNDLENTNQIQMLKEELAVNSVVGSGETKIYAKDNIAIDNVDNLVEVLKMNTEIVNRDIKISYNKVLTKAEAEIKVVYLTEDNRINKVSARIPIVGFIDIPEVKEEDICNTNYEIRNMLIKPNSVEEHSIYVEIEVCVNTEVYEKKNINIIQDLYSPDENIEFSKKSIKTIEGKRHFDNEKEIKEKVKIEELGNRNIIDVDINPIIEKETTELDKIIYEGNLDLKFILADDNMQVRSVNKKIPYEYSIDNVEDTKNLNISNNIEIANQDFIIQNEEEVLANVKLKINTDIDKNININTIDEIQTNGEREEQDYSIVMYIVKKDDSLWKIAKKFGSTVDDIVRLNGIENPQVIYPGQKIFIPRYQKKAIANNQPSMINYG